MAQGRHSKNRLIGNFDDIKQYRLLTTALI
jgi:hypothetical protein